VAPFIIDKNRRFKISLEVLRQALNREPTDEEIAEALQQPLAKIKHLRSISLQPWSLDASVSKEDDTPLGDLLEQELSDPFETVAERDLREQIECVLAQLRARERDVIELRYGLRDGSRYTREAIGQQLGVTRERVRQIEERALKKMRLPVLRQLLEEFA
jgi:RNA polymerase primary sigma factor